LLAIVADHFFFSALHKGAFFRYTDAMPELPEVETVMHGMMPALENATIQNVTINRFDLRGGIPRDFAERVTGAYVDKLERRGKYIIAHLNNDTSIILHLGMSGRIRIFPQATSYDAQKHDHVIFDTAAGARIAFEDPRRFGMLYLAPRSAWDQAPPFSKMGSEPLDNHFHAQRLASALTSRKSPIKSALLDQNIVAGLGNIYVCEALYRAHISPLRLSNSLNAGEIDALTAAIKDVLRDAIAAGGSTLRDYQHTDGELGYFQHRFDVYGRKDEPCKTATCDATVQHCVQSGRSTFYCAQCQL